MAIQTYKERSEHAKSRNKQAGVYSFKELGMDLEPYSLFPKEEVAKLLQLTFILITINVKAGKKVSIPKFGEFFCSYLTEESGRGRNLITGLPIKYAARQVMKFRPYPFVRWLMAPHQKSGQIAGKQARYRTYLDKVKAVFIHSAKYLGFFQEVYANSYISPEKQADYEARSANPRKLDSLSHFR
jgi:nucleoid DNA-binding protein